MPLDIRFSRNEDGKPTVFAPSPYEALGALFEHEIGPDPELGDWILDAINEVFVRQEEGAIQIAIDPERVNTLITIDCSNGGFVECCYDLPEGSQAFHDTEENSYGEFLWCELPAKEFEEALVNWLLFIRT